MVFTPEIIAVLVFLITYALIIDERIHRSVCALAGASVLVLFGILSWDKALSSIDFGTIFLLIGMMVIVNVTRRSGLFEYIAIRTAKISGGDPLLVFILFTLVTAIISAFLDNVTTVLLMTPMILTIVRLMKVNPVPYVLGEIFASNIGGTATLIGDPPNIMIGSATGLSFNEFIRYMTPIALVDLIIVLIFLALLYRKDMRCSPENRYCMVSVINQLDEQSAIVDSVLFRRSIVIICLVTVFFFVHNLVGLEPAEVALIGASALLFWTREPPELIFEKIEWSALFFFGGLFVLVGGLVETGVISAAARWMVSLVSDTGGAMVAIIWFSAFSSGVVDNIPLTAAMIPLIQNMGTGSSIQVYPLWWALSLGACLGGNMTAIGASANVVVLGLLERDGLSIGFVEFLKVGFWIMILTVFVGMIILFLMFPQFLPW